jgi:trans-aconitate 2-methyltransferase
MPDWNAGQYLRFADERTRPCRDLAFRIAAANPRSVIDLGCGPGNSTAVLRSCWPQAQITGLDGSAEMLKTARAEYPDGRWIEGDIPSWAAASDETFDVVFSNAALQWVGSHQDLFPRLLGRVAPGGVLAVQIPARSDSPAFRIVAGLASRRFAPGSIHDWHAHEPAFYYDLLAPHASRLDIWKTIYQHVMDGPEAIVEWYKGSGLRPYLGALSSEAERQQFLADYLDGIRREYPPRPDGRVLFPFHRIFIVAYR